MMIGIGMLIGAFLIVAIFYVIFTFEDWIDLKISNNTAITRATVDNLFDKVCELEKQMKQIKEGDK